jgi:hypothetical protein
VTDIGCTNMVGLIYRHLMNTVDNGAANNTPTSAERQRVPGRQLVLLNQAGDRRRNEVRPCTHRPA